MMELTINNTVYSFAAGFGFLRDVEKEYQINGENQGLIYRLAGLVDRDPEALLDVLDLMNKNTDPRISKKDLESYIEAEDTEIDRLFEDVLDFLKTANCTGKKTRKFLEEDLPKIQEQAKREPETGETT